MRENGLFKWTLSFCLMWVLALTLQAQGCYSGDSWKKFQEKRKARKELAVQPAIINRASFQNAENAPTLYGSIFYYDVYCATYYSGIYSFNPYNVSFTEVARHDHLYACSGVYVDGKYYSINYKESGFQVSEVNFSTFDAETWQELSNVTSSDFSRIATDLTYDPVTKKVYGCFFSPTEYNIEKAKVFATLNLETGQPEVIANLDKHLLALACNKEGVLYAIAEDANLYKVNKQTGTLTLIGNTGIYVSKFYQSAVFDYATDKMYWTGGWNDWGDYAIMEVDVNTGKAIVLVDLYSKANEQVTGLFIKQEAGGSTEVAAPQSATELNFMGSAQNDGNFSFKMPELDTQNNPLTGTLPYIVYANTTQVAQGTASPGEYIYCPLTFGAGGAYDLTVEVGEEGSKSTASMAAWVGRDTPLPVTNLTVKVDGKNVNLSWIPTTGSVHNGYMETVTHKIIRYPDKVVYEGISNCMFSDQIEDDAIRTYSYDVIAVAGGLESEAVRSEEIVMGSVIADFPYKNDFNTQEEFDSFTVVDTNNDGSTWAFDAGSQAAAYTYNQKNAANDWLISPAFKLEASKMYKVAFKSYNSYPTELISMAYGFEPTAEGMVNELLSAYEVTYNPRIHELSAVIVPKANGIYYFGIMACSEADRSTLYVDEVVVTVIPGEAPGQVKNLNIVPGDKGALTAQISFEAPAACIDGSALTNLDSFVIRRNKQEIARIPYTGDAMITYTDNGIQEHGMYHYQVIAVNPSGEGAEAASAKYVGIDVPGPIENFTIVEDLNEEGTLVLNWNAPSKGQNGGYIDPDKLTYFVSVGLSDEAVSNGNSTTFRDKLDISHGQTYQGYSVYADNEVGSGRNVWQTKCAVAGPALKAPYYDSFTNIHFNGPWLSQMITGEIFEASWVVVDGTQLTSWSHDGDNGVLSFSTTTLNRTARIESPKIDIRPVEGAKLIFWVFMTGKADKLDVQISEECKPFKTVQNIMLNESNSEWKRFEIPLDAYKDTRFIQVGFAGTSVVSTEQIISLDNVSIQSHHEKDITVIDFKVKNPRVKVGDQCLLEMVIRNSGLQNLNPEDFTVEVYKNDKLVNEYGGTYLYVDKRYTYYFKCDITVGDKEDTYFYAVVKYEGDECIENNTSEKGMVRVILPNYPAVTDLTGKACEDCVELVWSEPDMNDISADPVTDHFEDYQAFTINNFGGWKVYDGDQAKTIQLTLSIDAGPLDYANAGKPMAFQVFNSTKAGIPLNSWTPYSGEQMLCAFKCTSDEGRAPKNDDWLISPQLNGKAQKIAFFAKAGMAGQYEDGSSTIPEEFEVYYSSTSDEVTAFQKVGETYQINDVKQWQEICVELPEGAKYFAVRCISDNKFALMLDDFTYIPASAPVEDLSLLTYYIYKNDEMLGSSSETFFQDKDVQTGTEYTYNVTALYNRGESVYSNDFTIIFTPTSIEDVQCMVMIFTRNQQLMIQGADHVNVSVYTLTGECIFNELVVNNVAIPVTSGVYLVKVGNRVTKVLVP